MSTLTVDFIMSLDGYAAADGWPGYWGMEGPEYLASVEEGAKNEHVVLLGATTYRLMSGYAADLADDRLSPRRVVLDTDVASLSIKQQLLPTAGHRAAPGRRRGGRLSRSRGRCCRRRAR
ncbi:MAG: dihydrofolate reductase family protein [Pseudonocardia sp.]|nr:dihydrofolate reductase family protein [Pseudonocardia sp.]